MSTSAASVLSDFELQLAASEKAVRTATRGQSESVRRNASATSFLLILCKLCKSAFA